MCVVYFNAGVRRNGLFTNDVTVLTTPLRHANHRNLSSSTSPCVSTRVQKHTDMPGHVFLVVMWNDISAQRNRRTRARLTRAYVRARTFAYLPTSGAVAVAFVFKVRDASDHPVVNLRQCQSFVWGAFYGFGNKVCVRQVAPGVPPRGRLPWGLLLAALAARPRARRGRRSQLGGKRRTRVVLPVCVQSIGQARTAAVLSFNRTIGVDRHRAVILVVLFLGNYVSVIGRGLRRAGLRQWPSARSRPLLRLKIRINGNVQSRQRLQGRLCHRLYRRSPLLTTSSKLDRQWDAVTVAFHECVSTLNSA